MGRIPPSSNKTNLITTCNEYAFESAASSTTVSLVINVNDAYVYFQYETSSWITGLKYIINVVADVTSLGYAGHVALFQLAAGYE